MTFAVERDALSTALVNLRNIDSALSARNVAVVAAAIGVRTRRWLLIPRRSASNWWQLRVVVSPHSRSPKPPTRLKPIRLPIACRRCPVGKERL